jgi:hypothetical protein
MYRVKINVKRLVNVWIRKYNFVVLPYQIIYLKSQSLINDYSNEKRKRILYR